jgi:hypothetical protein
MQDIHPTSYLLAPSSFILPICLPLTTPFGASMLELSLTNVAPLSVYSERFPRCACSSHPWLCSLL